MSEKDRIQKRLLEVKREITKLGHEYISTLPKPIPLDDMVKELKPWGEVEKSIENLQRDLQLRF